MEGNRIDELRARAKDAEVRFPDKYNRAKHWLMDQETMILRHACRGEHITEEEFDCVLRLRRLVALRYDPIERCWKDLEAD
jgi:hypothetical protein